MRIRIKVFLGILICAVCVYIPFIWLFSAFGNAYIANLLAKELQDKTNLIWIPKHFTLTPSSFSLEFTTQDRELELFSKGNFSLFLQTLKGDFLLQSNGAKIPLNLQNIPYFKNFTHNQILHLEDNTWFEGEFSGTFSDYTLQANNNFARGQNSIRLDLAFLHPKNLQIHLKDISLERLLYALNTDLYFDGMLNANLTLSNLLKTPNGDFSFNIDGGDLHTETFLKAFNLKIPPTHFIAQLQGNIAHHHLEHDLSLYSSFGDILSKGATHLQSLATNTDFTLQLQNLSPLSFFFKIPLNGNLQANGILKGDFNHMLLNSTAKIQNSPLTFNLSLQKLKPHTLQIQGDNIQAQSLFTLFNQPSFLTGNLNISLNLRDFSQGISGILNLNSNALTLNSPLLETYTNLGFPASLFTLESKIELAQGKGIFDTHLRSNVADFTIQKGAITLKPFTLSLPHTLKIPKLENLSFSNKSLLNGALDAKGNITQEQFEFNGNITRNNTKNPISINLSKNATNLFLSNLTSTQIYQLFPKMPKYFLGNTNLQLKIDHLQNTKHINLDISQLQFHNTALKRALNRTNCKILNNSEFKGHMYHTLMRNSTLQSAITLNSKDSTIQTSKIITNLNNFNITGNLAIQCKNNSILWDLSGNLYQPKINPKK